MIFFLFGLPGVGKSYVGRYFSKYFGVRFWDGDDVLTDEMKQFVRAQKNFTPAMTAFISQSLINKIKQFQASTEQPVIVAQALLKEVDRQALKKQFDDIIFIRVECNEQLAEARVQKRHCEASSQASELVTADYARKIRMAYKKKKHDENASQYPTLINDGNDAGLVSQLSTIMDELTQQKREELIAQLSHSNEHLVTFRRVEAYDTAKNAELSQHGFVADAVLPRCGIINSSVYFFQPGEKVRASDEGGLVHCFLKSASMKR